MAFHLHRLGLVGRGLREAGYNKNDAADIAGGRTSLNTVGVTDLAARLGIAQQQLTRSLSDDETRAWSFYRRAAADPQHVWSSARNAWQSATITDHQAAEIMGLDRANLARTIARPARRVLTFERAARLTTALNIVEGPEVFLPEPKNTNPQHTR